jgi:hypothetical protein
MGYRVSIMTMETKNEIFERYKAEYYKARALKKGGRRRCGEILNIVCDVSKMTRKAAIRKFRRLQSKDPCSDEKRGRAVYYTADVTAALKYVWDSSNGLCGELLHPVISDYVEIFKRARTWNHSDEATGKLLKISERTVKRRVHEFEKTKRKGQGFSSTSPSDVKTIIPVFMGPWRDLDPGHEQIDTVVHCGSTLKGDMVYTLNSTDVATYWNLLGAQWNKGEQATIENRKKLRARLPFQHLHDHSDTGSEFINWDTVEWNEDSGVKLTRSRPNKKNDNAFVEERNGHIVRKYVGYIRLDCIEDVEALNDLFLVLNLYTNHFIPSRRTIENVRVGATYKRTFGKAATPYRRVLAHSKISDDVKEKLRAEHVKLNPEVLLKEIGRLRTILYDVQRKHGSQIV